MMKFYDLTELMEVKIARGHYKLKELVGSPLDFAIQQSCSPELAKRVFKELVDKGLLSSSDSRNYFITDDESIIKRTRIDLSKRAASRYLEFTKELGIEKNEAKSYI
ncbi:MAG: hypothetical protein J6A55_03775, partial [Oscillospiraceae bacterium]|nr:hypothetical protein [Oscillospiraceae bacterium]